MSATGNAEPWKIVRSLLPLKIMVIPLARDSRCKGINNKNSESMP